MALRSVSTSELRRELERREKGSRRLLTRRIALARTLASLDAELAGLGLLRTATALGRSLAPARAAKAPASAKRRRARNETSLPEVIAKVVRLGATVTPAEVSARVKASGYRSSAAHFGMMVSNALAKDARFKRVARGQYERVK
jgi:hypothetical protein